MALNVLGEPLEDELVGDSEKLDFDECEIINGPGQGFTEATSAIQSFVPGPAQEIPSSDITSMSEAVQSLSITEVKAVPPDSYLDQEVQRLVSGFITAKLDAVKVEDFHLAKLYKTGYEQVIKWADEIQALDVEKRRAAEAEDFDLAQDLKAQVNDIKAKMNIHLTQNGFYVIQEEDLAVITMTPPPPPDYNTEDASASPDRSLRSSSFLVSKIPSVGNFSNLSSSALQNTTSNSSIENSRRRITASRKSLPPTPSYNRPPSTTSENSSDPERPRRDDYSGKIPLPFSRSQSSGLVRQTPGSPNHRHSNISGIGSNFRTTPILTGVAIGERRSSADANISRISFDSFSKGRAEDDLSEQDRKTFATALEIFPTRIISSIVSRDLQDRLYALEYVREFMENENYQDDLDQICDKVRWNIVGNYRALFYF